MQSTRRIYDSCTKYVSDFDDRLLKVHRQISLHCLAVLAVADLSRSGGGGAVAPHISASVALDKNIVKTLEFLFWLLQCLPVLNREVS